MARTVSAGTRRASRSRATRFPHIQGSPPHQRALALSSIRATKETTPIMSGSWGKGCKLPLQPGDPFSQRFPPPFPALSFLCNTCKGPNTEHKNTYSFIRHAMPQVFMDLVTLPGDAGIWEAGGHTLVLTFSLGAV